MNQSNFDFSPEMTYYELEIWNFLTGYCQGTQQSFTGQSIVKS